MGNSRPNAVKIETTGDDLNNKPLCYNSIPYDNSSQQTCCTSPSDDASDRTMCLPSSSSICVAIPDNTLSYVPPSSSSSLRETNNSTNVDELFESSDDVMPTHIQTKSSESNNGMTFGSNLPTSMVIDPYSGDEGID